VAARTVEEEATHGFVPCGGNASFSALHDHCPEPVLANRSFSSSMRTAPKGVFRTEACLRVENEFLDEELSQHCPVAVIE
jgi:hypothetical protein